MSDDVRANRNHCLNSLKRSCQTNVEANRNQCRQFKGVMPDRCRERMLNQQAWHTHNL
ncbi:hypothetical protein HYC85_029481 [Camellia sinensis]|uniref:Uncharacterized protein n=1 Tax=Camellia sinensis TaxID=4442 RepID=A0A7J7FY33_CAMSI|nr:hypothetical protein HYC85_029481 [Camellia sinensis]